MKISLLTMESFDNRRPNTVGSSRIRGRWIIDNWQECEAYKIGDNPDVMIYQKAYWKDHMQQYKGLKIFDLCDPDWLDGGPVVEVAEYMDAMVVPTKALKDALDKMVKIPVFVIPDRFDLTVFPKRKTVHNGRGKYVMWYGYSTNAHVLEKVRSTIKEFALELTCIADRDINMADNFVKYDWETFHSDAMDYDFVILPNGGNSRFKYKSNNKTVEMQLLGLPVAKTYEDIQRFLLPTERAKESEKMYNEVVKEYDIKNSVKEWKKLIKGLYYGHK